jgi:hypothetical protein
LRRCLGGLAAVQCECSKQSDVQEVGVHGREGLIACRFVGAAEFVIAGWSGSCGRRRLFCEKY